MCFYRPWRAGLPRSPVLQAAPQDLGPGGRGSAENTTQKQIVQRYCMSTPPLRGDCRSDPIRRDTREACNMHDLATRLHVGTVVFLHVSDNRRPQPGRRKYDDSNVLTVVGEGAAQALYIYTYICRRGLRGNTTVTMCLLSRGEGVLLAVLYTRRLQAYCEELA